MHFALKGVLMDAKIYYEILSMCLSQNCEAAKIWNMSYQISFILDHSNNLDNYESSYYRLFKKVSIFKQYCIELSKIKTNHF